MSHLTIRQAVLADLDTLVPLFDGYRQFYQQQRDLEGAREFLRARFEHGQSTVLLAFDGETAVGFTQLYPLFSSTRMKRFYLLNDLFVAESGRKKGVGRGLLDAAVAYARALGACGLTLSTAVSNETAQRVYEAAGWKRDSQYLVYDFEL